MNTPPIAAPTGETGFEVFEPEHKTLFDLLCGSRLFWLGLALWVGSSIGLAVGFFLGVKAVTDW